MTDNYDGYTFDVETGAAVEAAGNCHVVLTNCTIRAPEGIRASENAVVTVRGGSLTAKGLAVNARGDARVSFEGTTVTGGVARSDNAQITGIADAGR